MLPCIIATLGPFVYPFFAEEPGRDDEDIVPYVCFPPVQTLFASPAPAKRAAQPGGPQSVEKVRLELGFF